MHGDPHARTHTCRRKKKNITPAAASPVRRRLRGDFLKLRYKNNQSSYNLPSRPYTRHFSADWARCPSVWQEEVDPVGRSWAGMPSMSLSCKAASMSKASSCVRLHLCLGGSRAEDRGDNLRWSASSAAHRSTGLTCDWLRHLGVKGRLRFQQIWAGLAWAYIRGEEGGAGLQPLPVKTLEVSYPDLDLTPSSGMLAILITGW